MTKPVLLIVALFYLLNPLAVLADNHDEVTIRVMQMDEETPDSVINRIELPSFEGEEATDTNLEAYQQNDFADQDMGFASEMGAGGFEAEVEVQGIQNEISNQGHGK